MTFNCVLNTFFDHLAAEAHASSSHSSVEQKAMESKKRASPNQYSSASAAKRSRATSSARRALLPIIKLPPVVSDRVASDDEESAFDASPPSTTAVSRQSDASDGHSREGTSTRVAGPGATSCAASSTVDSHHVAELLRKMVMARIHELKIVRARVKQQQDGLVVALRRVQERQMELKCDLSMAYSTARLLLADSVVICRGEDFNVCAERALLALPDAELSVSREDAARWM
jgi:uncharacterized membrane protein